jgi:hypothetical protein
MTTEFDIKYWENLKYWLVKWRDGDELPFKSPPLSKKFDEESFNGEKESFSHEESVLIEEVDAALKKFDGHSEQVKKISISERTSIK